MESVKKVSKSTPLAIESRKRCRKLDKEFGKYSSSYALHLIKLNPNLVDTARRETTEEAYRRILKDTTEPDREEFRKFYITKKSVKAPKPT